MDLTRRYFLGTTGAAAIPAGAAPGGGKLPTRKLGKTGVDVTILAFGSGSRFLAYKEEDKALAALNRALDSGIRYIDTAQSYGDGQSETWVGKLMPKRRQEVFLATKTPARTADDAMRRFEQSLKRLQTDRVDLLHIHSLTSDEDLAAIEAKGGVLEALHKIRDQKAARFIGITCHTDPAVLKKALERHDFDCTQMALNAARAGQAKGISGLGEYHPHSFETLALPVAKRKNMGVIAMKVFAQDGLIGKADPGKLIRYSLSLPVSAAVLGMPKVEFIDSNIAVARSFEPMAPGEHKRMSDELTAKEKARLDRFFNDHVDA